MRRLAIAFVLLAVACGGHQDAGPAWPKSAGIEIDPDDDPKDDGGESIEPRKTGSVASVEASTEPGPAAEPATAPADAPAAPSTDQPTTSPTTTDAPPTDPVIEGEIIIEVKPD